MINKNLKIIKEKIRIAAEKTGRSQDDITLVAVSKTFTTEHIIPAYKAGQRVFGENRLQEALEKIEQLKGYNDINFHFIGHIQSNKIKYFNNHFSLIQSVDRIEVAEKIDRKVCESHFIQDILVQVNLTKEEQKSGVHIEKLGELVEKILKLRSLVLCGFMYIPPYRENAEGNRNLFKEMKRLFDNYKFELHSDNFKYLSMGMSGDFEIAIEEGSNMVRIGTAIFGSRNY
jgi:hypothetical protein